VNTVGPIRQLVRPGDAPHAQPRRYLAIAAVTEDGALGPTVQVQAPPDAASERSEGTGSGR
jgi:hypothetical protein